MSKEHADKKDFTFTEFQANAVRTLNPALDNFDAQLTNCALGLTGESGEVAEIVKHYLTKTHEMTYADGMERVREKIIKELGDIMWYIASTCHLFGVDMGDVARANNEKLAKRHGNSFSGHGNRTETGA